MRIRARNLVVYTLAVALAAANGFTPRHAQAAHPHAGKAVAHDQHDVDAPHHHHDAPKASAGHCDDEVPAAQSPLGSCCVASCAAAAFIFASFELGKPLLDSEYNLLSTPASIEAAPNSADPPPR